MQRSPSLKVLVHCPHHDRPVSARRNMAIDRLSSCDESESCRAPATPTRGDAAARTFPHGCPVYPSLAK